MRQAQAKGFTYLMLLWWVAVASVMLMVLGRHWAFERHRDKEIEMVFRANEIQRALASYYRYVPTGGQPSWPKSLQDLVEDRRGPQVQRHLRRIWIDPLTGKANWGLILEDPAEAASAAQAASAPASGVISSSPFAASPFSAASQASSPFSSTVVDATPGIHGVFSRATGTPLRAPPDIKHYDEWHFDAGGGSTRP